MQPMTAKADYYEVLSISREASEDEIRRAYRKCALKYHPDRNPGDGAAESKFKEATEAFSVLSDHEKRARYDRFGHAGLDGAGFDFSGAGIGDILSQFQDMFSDFFGGGVGFSGGGRRRQARGQDVLVAATISLSDVMQGTKREVSVRGAAACQDCDASGVKPGTRPEACPQCRGSGQVTTQRGFIMFSTPCANCQGTGQFIRERCATCRGTGQLEKERSVLVTFPVGIDSGQRLRVPGQGMPGPKGAPSGDLYVDVNIEPDERFEREGADLVTQRQISFLAASMGTEVELALPDGSSVAVKIPSGTQPGTVISTRGRGLPHLDRHARGDLHLVVNVFVPKKLSRKARKLLGEIDDELLPKA